MGSSLAALALGAALTGAVTQPLPVQDATPNTPPITYVVKAKVYRLDSPIVNSIFNYGQKVFNSKVSCEEAIDGANEVLAAAVDPDPKVLIPDLKPTVDIEILKSALKLIAYVEQQSYVKVGVTLSCEVPGPNI